MQVNKNISSPRQRGFEPDQNLGDAFVIYSLI